VCSAMRGTRPISNRTGNGRRDMLVALSYDQLRCRVACSASVEVSLQRLVHIVNHRSARSPYERLLRVSVLLPVMDEN
jgi:hypothetical protein